MRAARPTRTRYVVLGALCTAAVIAYIHRGCLSVPKQTIQSDLGLDAAQMETVLSAFFLGYAVFQIPGGWIGDRFGTRRSLTIFMLLWSTATGLMSLADGFAWLITMQIVNGMAQAGIFPCCVKTFSCWFPRSERAFPNGLLGSFMSVGGALATSLMGLLLLLLPWQGVLPMLAGPGAIFAIGFFLWFRDRPQEHSWVNDEERRWIEGDAARDNASPPASLPEGERGQENIHSPVGKKNADTPSPLGRGQGEGNAGADAHLPQQSGGLDLFFLVQLGLVSGQQFFRASAYIFYTTLFPTFLQKARGVGESESGFWTSVPLLGVVFGSVTGGLAMDAIMRRTGNATLSRKGMGVVGVLGAGLFLTLAYLPADVVPTIALITASTFCSGLSGAAAYTVTIDMGGKHIATVFSIMNTAGNVGATLLPVGLGWLVRQTSWNDALLFAAALYGGAGVCWSLVRVREQS